MDNRSWVPPDKYLASYLVLRQVLPAAIKATGGISRKSEQSSWAICIWYHAEGLDYFIDTGITIHTLRGV
jgi:hypothetical protein